jgi:mono/diheme cytochrome c family protein
VTTSTTIAALAALAIAVAPAAQSAEPQTAKSTSKRAAKQIERGRYLLTVGNCNDCHSDGFAPSEGKVPERDWLLGSPLGLRGPWGTTYATNLRLSLSRMTEEQWVKYARALKTRPPMPWFNLNQWNDADLRSFYRYVRQLGPVGEPAPQALPPGQEPKPPYIQWPAPPKR